MVDSRAQGEGGEGARMHDHPIPRAFLPPFHPTLALEGEKGCEGDARSSVVQQDPHPHDNVSRTGVAAAVGDRQGNVRGVGGLYKAGARGGELSSSNRSVSVASY